MYYEDLTTFCVFLKCTIILIALNAANGVTKYKLAAWYCPSCRSFDGRYDNSV